MTERKREKDRKNFFFISPELLSHTSAFVSRYPLIFIFFFQYLNLNLLLDRLKAAFFLLLRSNYKTKLEGQPP